ncbi:alpha/beta fold hydrolase [Actinomarinicola tropica]|uniref:Alpha/beta fold hydrolase n=1 Tax=Actinomarinicola tropica TaxID=2789776 RepID=A0A5Q2RS35_9ACTN|nr:alpha/beta hydrolase [Actinomarinicola tropica]QGG96710.1 alpha/beta fold hydrolase [Actinomarinicola tropica]
MTAPILVLHAPGDPAAGAPWRGALEGAGWDGPVVAPDLPGHGDAPPPTGGHHELADAAFAAVGYLADAGLDGEPPVVVGIGANGWPAQLLALGGRARALVLVDGLGGPWRTAPEAVAARRDQLRALAADPAAVAPHAGPGTDPRLAHGPRPHDSRDLAWRAARAATVPTLLIESPASPTPRDDLPDLVDAWASPVDLRRVPGADPTTVAAHVTGWQRADGM